MELWPEEMTSATPTTADSWGAQEDWSRPRDLAPLGDNRLSDPDASISLSTKNEQSRLAALSPVPAGHSWNPPPSLNSPPPVTTRHPSSKVDEAGNMQTCLIKAGSQNSISPSVIQPIPTTLPKVGQSQAFIACQMEAWAAEATEQFSLVPNTFFGGATYHCQPA